MAFNLNDSTLFILLTIYYKARKTLLNVRAYYVAANVLDRSFGFLFQSFSPIFSDSIQTRINLHDFFKNYRLNHYNVT